MHKSKKGDLSLSTNAIVVLIFAVVMLGLGLAFVRNTFGGIQDQFNTNTVLAEPNPADATPSEPISLSRNALQIRGDTEGVLKVKVFNTDSTTPSPAGREIKIELKPTSATNNACNTIGTGAIIKEVANSGSKTKVAKEVSTDEFILLITPKSVPSQKMIICSIEATIVGSTGPIKLTKDFTLTITP